MNPLSIIGSVVGVAGVAAISFGAVQAFYGFVGMIEAETEARIEKVLMIQAEKYRQTTQKKADEEEAKDNTQRATWDAERQVLEEKNNELFQDIEGRIREDAGSFDNDLSRTIAAIMCKAKNIGDNRARQACDLLAEQADFTAAGAILSITPKRIEDWRNKCEETGEDLYCDYAIPAITAAGIKDIIDWMTAADAALLVYDSNQDIYARQIDDLQNQPEPTIGERQ